MQSQFSTQNGNDEIFWRFSGISIAETWINPGGFLILRLRNTFSNLPKAYYQQVEEYSEFSRICSDELKQSLATLMDNSLLSYLKIITKDKTVFFANKIILCGNNFIRNHLIFLYINMNPDLTKYC